MNIMNKKFLRTLLLMLLPAFFVGQAFGQKVEPNGFVGDDLYKLLYEGEGDDDAMTVTIGKKGNTSECVYEWEMESRPDGARLPNIVSPTQPQTAVVFYDVGSYMFKLTRVSIYGYQQEYVTVMLYGGIKLLSAKPENPNKCWVTGNVVHDWDFDFETEPPGYNSRVHVAEEDAKIDNLIDHIPIHDHIIHFTIDGQPGLERVTAVIPIYNTLDMISFSTVIGTANTPSDIAKQKEQLKGAWDKIKEAGVYVKKMNSPSISGFVKKLKEFSTKAHLKFQPIYDVSIAPSGGLSLDCCNGDATVFLVLGGTIRLALGGSMDVPVPGFYIPGIGGLAIVGYIQVETDVFPVPNMTIPITTSGFSDCFQTNISFPIRVTGDLGGGVEVISRDVASAVLGFEFKVDGGFDIHTSAPHVTLAKGTGLKVYSSLQVKVASFSTSICKYMLYPYIKEVESVEVEP